MPRVLTDGAILEVTLVGDLNGSTSLNILHYRAEGVTGSPDFTSQAQEFFDSLNALGGLLERYKDCISDDWFSREVRLQLISPVRYSYQTFLWTGTGTEAQPALPPNDSIMLIKRNVLTGRRNRGSLHLPGVPVTFVAEGRITTAASLVVNNLGDVMVEAITGVATPPNPAHLFVPVIFNKDNPIVSPRFDSATAQFTSRVMRRRTVGLGI